MYGRIHQRKLKEEDYIMSAERARMELDQYINDQSKRVNVDSAKKRAVLQHMDYEGFRQMVLGANIFPTKSNELYQFSKGEENSFIPNKILLIKPKQGQKQQQPIQKLEEKLAKGNSQKQCTSFRDFKKKFNKYYQKQLTNEIVEELYSLLKQQNEARLNKIFNMECQANILVKIAQVYDYVLNHLQKNNVELLYRQASYIAKFFQTIMSIQTMKDFSLQIVTKKQKNRICETLLKIKQLLPEDAQTIEKITLSICK